MDDSNGKRNRHRRGGGGGGRNEPRKGSEEIRTNLGVKLSSPWENYEKRSELGEGGFSTIFRAKHRRTGKSVAVKVLEKSSKHSRDTFFIEVKLLRSVEHDSIVKMIEAYEHTDAYYIVMELQRGRDLFDVLDEKRDVFPEVTAAKLLSIMASAIEHCHSRQIVHLDLKPENFVFAKSNDLNRLMLIDFGLGRVVKDDAAYRDRVGSMQYIAPEMIDEHSMCTGRMLKACDMWSLGVIIYILVTGLIPFATWQEVKHGKLRLSKSMSRELRHLLRGLLTRDSKKRLTASQVLRHPFVTGQNVEKNPIYQAIGAGVSLLRSREQPHLLRTVAQGMVLPLSVEDRYEIDALFEEFDSDGDGRLNAEEFEALIAHMDESGSTDLRIAEVHDVDEPTPRTATQVVTGSIHGAVAGDAGAVSSGSDSDGGAGASVTAGSGSDSDGGAGATSGDDSDTAGRPRSRSHDEMLTEIDGDGDGKLGRKDVAHLAAIGMIALRTPMAKRRIAFAFGDRKSKPYVNKTDLKHTLKSVPSHHLHDLFVCEDSSERERIPVEQFATAVLRRS